MRAWQEEQAGLARCCSSCWRSDAVVPMAASFRLGTPGGGGGGGSLRKFSRIHLPRMTGDVRVGYEETVRTLACVSTPDRSSPVKLTRRNSGPEMPGIP